MRVKVPRPFDVVVVIDAKRMTRTESWRERGLILGTLQDAQIKVAIASTDQVLDLNTDEGDLLIGLETHFAAKDNRSRRENVIRGKQEAIRKGKKPSGPTPFGYLYDRETATWSVDPVLGPVVIEIFERVAKGETCLAIAHDLQARGVPRARRSKTGSRKPGRWCRERVWQIVRARTYLGAWVANKAKKLSVSGTSTHHRRSVRARRSVADPPRQARAQSSTTRLPRTGYLRLRPLRRPHRMPFHRRLERQTNLLLRVLSAPSPAAPILPRRWRRPRLRGWYAAALRRRCQLDAEQGQRPRDCGHGVQPARQRLAGHDHQDRATCARVSPAAARPAGHHGTALLSLP